MQQRIEFVGINSVEFCQLFQCTEMPPVGSELQLSDGVKLVNLTSPSPNLFDASIFSALIDNVIGVASTLLLGIVSNYLYDKIKNKRINATLQDTKIIIIIENADDDERV